MARQYAKESATLQLELRRYNILMLTKSVCISAALMPIFFGSLSPFGYFVVCGLIPSSLLFLYALSASYHQWLETERTKESQRRGGKPVLGLPPDRQAFERAIKETREKGRMMIDRYLVGFEVDSGAPIWVSDDELCTHGCVFAKTGVGKTLWLEGLMFQQMARGRASGFTFIDAKRDPGTLADIIMMALLTGRIEDLVVVDPFDPVCAYNFVFTTQRADVKARKVLRCGLPPTSDSSTTKHYDRLAADAVYRVVRAMESFGLAWSVRDVAVALSAFNFAYPRLRELLHEQNAKQAMIELGHMASSYRGAKGTLDSARLTDNLRGIASELHSISNSEAGEMFCAPRADLSLTDAILRGKMIYYMLPRLEEAESAARMVKVFREDLEVSIGEITSNRNYRLEDPHLVIIDEGASTFGPTWANLFELARKGRFALLFGAQSVGGLMDQQMGLSEQFYERVIANVNLKVIMRVGDNRTAEDMCEWIGKVTTEKKSFGTGVSTSMNTRRLAKYIEFNKRLADGNRDAVTVAEDEEDLVSAEELKHEMSAEKGLAWFEKGDGRLRKGRAFWFEADLPPTWEGREFLTRYESVEADEIGLAEWVDEHILSIERAETERKLEGGGSSAPQEMGLGGAVGSSGGGPSDVGEKPGATEGVEEDGPFRFNLLRGFRGRARARTYVGNPETPNAEAPSGKEQSPEKVHNSAVSERGAPEAAEQSKAAPSAPPPTKEAAKPEAKPKLSFQRENAPTAQAAAAPPPGKEQNAAKSDQPRSAQAPNLSKQNEKGGQNESAAGRNGRNNGAPKAERTNERGNVSNQKGGEKQKLMLRGKGRDTVAGGNKIH